jgi:hypothetical protein
MPLKSRPFVTFAISMLPLAAQASTQARAGGAGHLSGLLLSLAGVFVLAAVTSWLSKSFASFFPILGGFLVLFVMSILGVELAVQSHLVGSGANRLVITWAVFACLLLVPAAFSISRKRKPPGA